MTFFPLSSTFFDSPFNPASSTTGDLETTSSTSSLDSSSMITRSTSPSPLPPKDESSTASPYSLKSTTGTIRSNRTFGPSSSSSLGSPFSVTDLEGQETIQHNRKEWIRKRPSPHMSIAPSGSFLEMHLSPHSPLVKLPCNLADKEEKSIQASFLDTSYSMVTGESIEPIESLPSLLAKSVARITEAESSSRYYQDACVLSTLDAEFWQREYQSLYQEYRQCDSRLEKMTRWCKELEDKVEMLENQCGSVSLSNLELQNRQLPGYPLPRHSHESLLKNRLNTSSNEFQSYQDQDKCFVPRNSYHSFHSFIHPQQQYREQSLPLHSSQSDPSFYFRAPQSVDVASGRKCGEPADIKHPFSFDQDDPSFSRKPLVLHPSEEQQETLSHSSTHTSYGNPCFGSKFGQNSLDFLEINQSHPFARQ